MELKSKRLYYIDCLKGFATLLVVLGHIFDGYIRAGYFSRYRDIMSSGYNLIYSFHMALFFLISGFVYRKAYFTESGTVKNTLKKQTYNVLVIYLVFSILFGLFKIVMGRYTNSDTTLVDVLLIWVKPIYPYWYLYTLIFYYLIFRIKKLQDLSPNLLIIVLAVIAIISNFIPDSIGRYFELKHFLYYSFFFGFGYVIASKELVYIRKSIIIPTFLISICILLIDRIGYTYEEFDKGLLLYNRKWNLLIAVGLSLMLFYLFKLLFSNGEHIHVKAMSFLGRYSLEIYVMHCIFTAGNRVILSKIPIDNFYLNVATNTIISIAVPIAFSLLCKKLNIHKLIFRPVYYFSERRNQQ